MFRFGTCAFKKFIKKTKRNVLTFGVIYGNIQMVTFKRVFTPFSNY